MKTNQRTAFTMLMFALLLFMVDRLLKYLAVSGTTAGPVDGGVRFELFQNPAIAFSIAFPTWASLALIPVVLAMFIGGAVRLFRRGDAVRSAALIVVVVAAFSNYLDRVLYGYVVDYVSVGEWFPVFNVSDVVMVVTIAALIVSFMRSSPRSLRA